MASDAVASLNRPGTGTIRVAIIGDVHGHWYADDAEALKSLGVDAAVFIGDFGEEDIGLIRRMADVRTPKAIILGNHDAWHSLTAWARKKWILSGAAKEDAVYIGVRKQLEILGADHVGYRGKGFQAASGASFSVVGARPFSKGGSSWAHVEQFYKDNYNVDGFLGSSEKIVEAVMSQPKENVVIMAAHNGPTGLGESHHDICGADFLPSAGDHGDPDLEEALEHLHVCGRHVPLVVFGHMHESLKFGKKLRNMVEISQETGTVYLNTAVVPRVRHLKVPATVKSSSDGEHSESDVAEMGVKRMREVTARQFTLAEVTDGLVSLVRSVWVCQRGRREGFEVVAEQPLLEMEQHLGREAETATGADGEPVHELTATVRRRIWRGYDQAWESVVSRTHFVKNVKEMSAEEDVAELGF